MSMANTSERLAGKKASSAQFPAPDESSFVNGTHLFVDNDF